MKAILRRYRIIWTSLLCLLALLFPLVSHALTVQEVPNPKNQNGGWVTDMANILSSSAEAQLNQIISGLEAKNGVELAVVTVANTAPAASPKEFATNLFNHWKIGKKAENNGLLFLTSVGDRRAEVETGYGLEAILPDAQVGNILKAEAIPQFKQGKYEAGILASTKAYITVLEAYQPGVSAPVPPAQQSDSAIPWAGLLGGSAILGGLGWIVTKGRKKYDILLEPTGRWLAERPIGNQKIGCATCKQPMKKLDSFQIQPYLSKPEQVATEIGSVQYEGFRCPKCYPQLTGRGIHICAHVLDNEQFTACSTCQELTAKIATEVVIKPTVNVEGKRLVIRECQCCGAYEEEEAAIPCLTPPVFTSASATDTSSYSSSSDSSYSSSSDSSYSSSSDSSYSSSSDFGGGSSGGGGGGDSW